MPDVSVVVLAREGPSLLARQLEALEDQAVDSTRYEVVVAEEEGRGEVGTRNDGWRRTRAPRVVFTNDACRAGPGWLQAMLAVSDADPGAVVHGPTMPFPDKLRSRGPLYHWVDRPQPDRRLPACNVLYPRDTLERLGGFDETFAGAEAADADLAARAVEAGVAVKWAPNATMAHDVVLAPATKLRNAVLAGELALVLRRHPWLREDLSRRIFHRPEHEWMLRAGLAVMLPARLRWLRWWLAAPYVGRVVGSRTVRLTWPFQLLCDVMEMAALIRGALRHRVFIL